MKHEWIDVTVPLRHGMVRWPGDPAVRIVRRSDMRRGDEYNLSSLAFSSHTGTHMDAHLHYLRGGKSLDRMPLSATVGCARVIEIRDQNCITPAELRPHRIRTGERILFKTRNSTRCWKGDSFFKDYVHITVEGAEYLAERRPIVIGIDYLSVAKYGPAEGETHRTLQRAGIWLIEGLDLSAVGPGRYDLVCLPLRIQGSDGAPARAILRKRAPR